jgi:zinc protease
MNFLRSVLLALLLIAGTPALAAGDADWFYRGSDIPRDPAWRFGTLANGVRYAVRRNALPEGQVSIRVRIDAGALHEADAERGWAHFVEHLAFRGSKSFGDREARHIWQNLGASFGSDTNAFTSSTQTVYQLDLPHADQAKLDQSLHVLSEMVDTALFDPAAVEAERKIVLQEKGRRPELSTRIQEASWPLVYGGLLYANRNTIGTDETLAAATAKGLRDYYERWYRPERTTVVMAGDADPAMMEQLIAKRFGDWRGTGEAPKEPDYGTIAQRADRAAAIAYPGVPYALSASWIRPYRRRPHTIARERLELAESIAGQILNRRLEAKARGDASYVSAGVGSGSLVNAADITQLSITAREGKWREALSESFAFLSDAIKTPPSRAEIARELQNLRTGATSAVEGEKTLKSPGRADQLVGAIDRGDVVSNAATTLKLVDRLGPQMTPAAIAEAYGRMFEGVGPRLFLIAPEPVKGGDAALEAALAAAEKAAPAARLADRKVTIDNLPPLGRPGREVSRQKIPDLGVTIVRFANGSSLTFKQTDYEKGSVGVQLRFGGGTLALRPDQPSLAWAGAMVGPSGVANLDLDALERLLTGRRMSLSFGVGEDAYELRGTTTGRDLQDQLRLLATKISHPRWDPAVFARYKTGALESYDLAFSSAAARAGREFGGYVRPGDARWAPVEKERIASANADAFKAFFENRLARGPIEAVIVGDVDLETAVRAMARTVGALPPRASHDPLSVAVQPPRPDPKPTVFTHEGDRNQAYAMIGWTTFGGLDNLRERRALSVAANMLQVRLFDRLREEEGATYSPSAASTSSEALPAWGIFYASAEIRPESADTFFRIAREEVAKLAAKPVEADEYARAINPVVSGIERRLRTNAYWLSAMENWVSEPALIEQTRSFLSDYRGMTAEFVRRAVAQHVADQGDWSMLVLPGKARGSGN